MMAMSGLPAGILNTVEDNVGGGIASALEIVTTDPLIGNGKEKLDVFSYHYYNGISERGAAMGGHWNAVRDKYVPGEQMWVTESGDAGCGGNTWAPTYADVPRTLNALGDFSTVTDGVIYIIQSYISILEKNAQFPISIHTVFLISFIGKSSSSRFVMIHSIVLSVIGNRKTRK